MTKQELELLKQDMDNKVKDAMKSIKDFEEGQISYKMSELNITVGDRIELKGVSYFFGGYVLPENGSSYSTLSRKPVATAFKIKKNGDSYKKRIYLYWEEKELLTKYGKGECNE